MSIPPDAATFRVQLWLNAAAGWVAFDDVSVRLVDGVTKYYYFNGQRIAMRQDNSLSYLHSDHLGSVVAATDETGAVINDNQPRYFAYGRERTASVNALPTEYTFTGQRQDNSRLIYMNARYYDPETGQFISSYPPGPNKSADSQDGRIMGVATLNSPILRIRTLIRHRFYNGQAQWRYACQYGPSRLVANYYSFNDQRIALRQGSKRYNLHTASKEQPLGSTKLVTDQSGNAVQASPSLTTPLLCHTMPYNAIYADRLLC